MIFKKAFYLNIGLALFFCSCKESLSTTYAGCCDNLPLIKKVGTIPIYVPNTFTPNFDLFNDNIVVFSGGDIGKISNFELLDKSDNIVWKSGTKLLNANENIISTQQELNKIPEGRLFYSFNVTSPTTGDVFQFQGYICKNTNKDAECPAKNTKCAFGNQNNNGVWDKILPTGEICQ